MATSKTPSKPAGKRAPAKRSGPSDPDPTPPDDGPGTGPAGGTPIAKDAEAAVVAALLTSADAYDDIIEVVGPDDFATPSLAAVFSAIKACDDSGRPFDPVTVADELRRSGIYDQIDGKAVLDRLIELGRNADNVLHHARIVAGKAQLRSLITVGRGIVADATDPAATPETALESAESAVFGLGETKGRSTLTSMTEAVAQTLAAINRAGSQSVLGHSTGFPELDALTGGYQGGQMIVVGARPAMGKSAWALGQAAHVARTTGKTVAFLSYEMSVDELTLRLLASEVGFDARKLQRGEIPSGMDRELAHAAERLTQLPILIDDNPPRTITGVRSAMRRLARRVDLGMVVIDYIQLMEGESRRGDYNRQQEISEISRGIKHMSVELSAGEGKDCPVIALSQLNRGLESRPNKRPILSDLRESGSLEQDANLVLALFRSVVYDETADPHHAEAIVLKQRSGPVGTIPMHFDGPSLRFTPGEAPAGHAPLAPAGDAPAAGGGGNRWSAADPF